MRSRASDEVPPVHRRADGSIDVEHYSEQARRLRSAALGRYLRAAVRLLCRALGRGASPRRPA